MNPRDKIVKPDFITKLYSEKKIWKMQTAQKAFAGTV